MSACRNPDILQGSGLPPGRQQHLCPSASLVKELNELVPFFVGGFGEVVQHNEPPFGLAF